MTEGRYDDEAFLEILKLVAPGTPLREGLENILKARTGALIVIGDTKEVMELVDGGFYINEEYSPARIYELAKMDGAIVLGKDMKRILYANAELVPDRAIPTQETGKRHRAAERVARQTGEIVISISQRRNIITLYKGTFRYVLKDTSVILTRANQALQTLQKYKSVLDNIMNNLSTLEFRDMVALENVVLCIQRTEMVLRINDEIKRDICELGTEGRLIKMQLEELVGNTEEEGELLVQDYLIHAGKILYWGTSEWPFDKIEEAIGLAEKYNLYKPLVEQSQYSLLHRERVEKEVLPNLSKYGMGLVVFSPLASGLLTGKYDEGIPEKSRIERLGFVRETWYREDHIARVRQLKTVAEELSIHRNELALAWILHQADISSVITGATHRAQLESNLKALDLRLSPEAIAKIDRIFSSGRKEH